MTRRRASVTLPDSRSERTESGTSGARVRSTLPAHMSWPSAAAIRQAIGAWAYTRGAGERRPEAEAVRGAVGVACAVRELVADPARRDWSGSDATVVEDVAELSLRSGFRPAEVEAGLTLLAAAGVVTRQSGAGGATVSLGGDVQTPAPVLTAIHWPSVRERLEAVGASPAPALAVLRELATSMGAFDLAGDDMAPVAARASVRDLEDATGFGRSTVADAVASLERARLLDVETRVGRTTRFSLRPSAFGHSDSAPEVAISKVPVSPHAAAVVESTGGVPAGTQAAAQSLRGALAPPVAGTSSLIGTFAGTPIYAPPGTPLVVDCDANGEWTCRVGPFLVLGPVRASD